VADREEEEGGIETLRVFIGHDAREAVAFHVCIESILAHTDASVSFHPVRGAMRDGSNSFTYARFLVPYLCGFRGWALFLDGDMLVRDDIQALFDAAGSHCGVQVVKHDYKTKWPVKYLGYRNEDYPRKNWSSVVLWNCSYFPNRVLTPAFVAAQSGLYLHRFNWLRDEAIGELSPKWNVLVREQELSPDDKLRHYTIGTPCFAKYADDDPEWHDMHATMNSPMSWINGDHDLYGIAGSSSELAREV
jgi:lipopolysaccharide biosynthesis glycosyltransferase